jgi:hypothetical protein
MHAVAVELDFVQPAGPVGCRVDQLRKLRPDPLRQSRRTGAPARYRPPHAGIGTGLRCQHMRLEIRA